MTTNEYLLNVLRSQTLSEDSSELRDLKTRRGEVEALLRAQFANASPSIRYGGSMAKGTLIRESYDLDLVCYFPNGENGAGETLRDIFQNVGTALSQAFWVDPKTSALRLRSKDVGRADFHIDVVPGRFTDDTATDCYLFQNDVDKERLKTNLQVHINFIRDAGVTPALRLLKLWRVRQALALKNFIWELLCIRLLDGMKGAPLEEQVAHVLETISLSLQPIKVEDPANPNGNDLMPALEPLWFPLRVAATESDKLIAASNWEAVFGAVEAPDKAVRSASLAAAVSSVRQPTRPWSA